MHHGCLPLRSYALQYKLRQIGIVEADVVNQLRQKFDSVSGGDGFIDMADVKRAAQKAASHQGRRYK